MVGLDRRFMLGLGASVPVLPALTVAAAGAVSTRSVSVAGLLQRSLPGDMSLGSPKAAVTIVEYGSTACRRCAAFSRDIFPKLRTDYIDTGKARFVFRAFPFDGLAMVTFMLLRCAPEDRSFPLLKVLFERQRSWESHPQELRAIFVAHGMSEKTFDACLHDETLRDGIEDGMRRAERLFHVNSTPTFFIDGKMLEGNLTFDRFKALIDAAL